MTNAPRAGGAWHRPLLFTMLGLTAGVGGTIAVVALTGDDGDSATPAATSTSSPAGDDVATMSTTTTVPVEQLGAEAKELVALAAKGRKQEFHARYVTTGGTPPSGQEFTVRMELWNKSPEVRRDVSITTGGQVLESADMRRKGLFIRCARPSAEAGWQCLTPPSATNDPGGVAFGLAPAALAGRPVTVTDETVADQEARCFRTASEGGSPEELCLSEQGIPLRVTSGAAILELEGLELSVADDAFEPPARPIGS